MCLAMTKLSKTRVLIVEDEPDIAGLMKHALERGGELDVEIVVDGRRGAEVGNGRAAQSRSARFEPALHRRPRGVPPAARAGVERGHSHHHGDGKDERDGPRRGARARRGRLRHQAVQPAGARRTGARRPAAAAANSGRAESRLPARPAGDRLRCRVGARVRGIRSG